MLAALIALTSLAACSTRGATGVDGSLLAYPNGTSRPVAGTVVASSAGRHVATARTGSDGTFSINLDPGTYMLDGTTSSGIKCRQDSVTLRKGARVGLTLQCI